MKISILAPVYNVAEKIERCAISLFEQTYKDIEYIFVDDCTPDNSIEVLQRVMERYPHRKGQVRILHHEVNKGLAGARNTGYNTISGDAIMIVDSDDYLAKDACELLTKKMAVSNADIVSGSYVSLQPQGKCVTIPSTDYSVQHNLKKHLCLSYGHCMLWSRLYRADLFASSEMRALEGVNLSEDYMMTARLLLNAKTAFIDEVVYYYDETELRDYSKIYDNHIRQLTQSVMMVDDFYRKQSTGRCYLPLIQMAYLYVIRCASQANLSSDEARRQLRWWTKPIAFLLRHQSTFAMGNLLYKAIRAILVM